MSEASALLKEPWSQVSRERDGATFGIWIFLASEILFFGAMILTYTHCPDAKWPDAGFK